MDIFTKKYNLDLWRELLPTHINAQIDAMMKQDTHLRTIEKKIIYPAHDNILNAMAFTPPKEVRVVILGQDPYHEPGQAMGLSFSVPNGVRKPPSLENIFKEYHDDLGYDIPTSGDLSPWTEQGVLLLNTVLTVEKGNANSHKELGWQTITQGILQTLLKLPQPIVFLLWGKQAEQVLRNCDGTNCFQKYALTSTHPSPFSASTSTKTSKAFLGSKPFSGANRLLVQAKGKPVDWKLPL